MLRELGGALFGYPTLAARLVPQIRRDAPSEIRDDLSDALIQKFPRGGVPLRCPASPLKRILISPSAPLTADRHRSWRRL
jgi:hypothetical protein